MALSLTIGITPLPPSSSSSSFFSPFNSSLERITQTAKELTEATGSRCTFAQADVRQPSQLRSAVDKAISTYGRIDFVICGRSSSSDSSSVPTSINFFLLTSISFLFSNPFLSQFLDLSLFSHRPIQLMQ